MMASIVNGLIIGKKIGNGCFGDVYLGEDNVHGQVAVKVLSRESHLTDDEWIQNKRGFLTEAKNLSKATHRNVVPVYHIQESADGNSIFYCMAYCSGGSLESLYKSGPMPLLQVRKVASEVCLGLDALHIRGMIHRDIKPGNILVDRAGVSQLGDFGLVTDEIVLGYAARAGYTDHVAHEVFHKGVTSVKSDIWALGMTLYRLIHGQKWYERMPRPAYAAYHGKLADSLLWLPHVPKSWRRAIRKMLCNDPSHRHQNAREVLTSLATLPIPDWNTVVDGNVVSWSQNKGQRTKRVDWIMHGPKHHEWAAWSEPNTLDKGRKMTLGKSEGMVSPQQARRELEHFFESNN